MNVPPGHTFGMLLHPDEYGKFRGTIKSCLVDETRLK